LVTAEKAADIQSGWLINGTTLMSRAGQVHHRVDCYVRGTPTGPVDQFLLEDLSDAQAIAEGKLHALQRECDYFVIWAITIRAAREIYDSRRG
jgi:hypothetical protein